MSVDEARMYQANRAVRDYVGPIKKPDGTMHPQWKALLDDADRWRRRVEDASPAKYPTCGSLR